MAHSRMGRRGAAPPDPCLPPRWTPLVRLVRMDTRGSDPQDRTRATSDPPRTTPCGHMRSVGTPRKRRLQRRRRCQGQHRQPRQRSGRDPVLHPVLMCPCSKFSQEYNQISVGSHPTRASTAASGAETNSSSFQGNLMNPSLQTGTGREHDLSGARRTIFATSRGPRQGRPPA